jgi:uracil-DNA glycosylase
MDGRIESQSLPRIQGRGSQDPALLFVGEKPSRKAEQNGLTWTDGKLAAKTLFDALDAAGICRTRVSFFNLFGMTADAAETGPTVDANVAQLTSIKGDRILVAMGSKVARHLDRHGVEHRKLIHPAARGKIRAKERYIAHVAEVLA